MGLFDRLRNALFGEPVDPAEAERHWRDVMSRVEPLARRMWRPRLEPEAKGGRRSNLGIAALLAPGESWPDCPKCGDQMELLVQLDSSDLPAEVESPFGGGCLQLWTCLQCMPFDAFDARTRARVLPPGAELVLSAAPRSNGPFLETGVIVGWDRSEETPDWSNEDEIDPPLDLSEEDWEELMERHPVNRRTKLLGWASWPQVPSLPSCPECGDAMRYFFQIDLSELVHGATGCVSVCPSHPQQLAWTWQR